MVLPNLPETPREYCQGLFSGFRKPLSEEEAICYSAFKSWIDGERSKPYSEVMADIQKEQDSLSAVDFPLRGELSTFYSGFHAGLDKGLELGMKLADLAEIKSVQAGRILSGLVGTELGEKLAELAGMKVGELLTAGAEE